MSLEREEMEIKFRDKIEKTVGQDYFILITIFIGLLLSIFAGQSGTLLFYIVVLITLWAKRWDWGYFGVNKTSLVAGDHYQGVSLFNISSHTDRFSCATSTGIILREIDLSSQLDRR